MLTKRQKDLLALLNQQSDFRTVEYFASKLGVSKRTTHLELAALKDFLASSEVKLEKKRGVGILLQKKQPDLAIATEKGREVYTTVDRRIEIMELLLFKTDFVSFNQLSELFLVSKSSIIKDFDFIMKILNDGSEVTLASDVQGTRLTGSEEELQKAFLQFNRFILSQSNAEVSERNKLLVPYYGVDLMNVCTNILYTYLRENTSAISDYYVQNILNIFIILVYRSQKQQHLAATNQRITQEELFFEESAVRMLHKAALRLNFSYTNEDVEYLSQQLVANRFENLPEDKTDKLMINRLITKVSESLKIDFSIDKKLEEQLRHHIPPMIYRLRSHNKTENPFTTQIKNEFSLTFNVIWVALSDYQAELAFNEDEIAFLTMYFQAAIERAKLNRKILVVCPMGIATSELLINRIKNVLPSLDSLEVASVAELENLELTEYDLIISTVQLRLDKKVIVVSPFLTEEDIEKIKASGYRPQKVSKVVSLSRGIHLQRFLQTNWIDVTANFSTKEELLKQVGQALTEKNYVEAAFTENVLAREALGGTDLPSGTAVPHGNMNHVKKTVVVAIKNQKKFKWCNYYVDIIFLICIAKEDKYQTRNILADIYNIIDDQEQLKILRQADSPQAFYQTIGSEGNGESN